MPPNPYKPGEPPGVQPFKPPHINPRHEPPGYQEFHDGPFKWDIEPDGRITQR